MKWGNALIIFAFGLSLGLLWHYKKAASKTENTKISAEHLRAIIKESSKQIVTEVNLSEKITISKNVAVYFFGDVEYKTATAIGSGIIQYGFDWEDVKIEVEQDIDSTTVYFYEPDLFVVGLSDLDIAYTDLSAKWGTNFTTNDIYELNQLLKDSLNSKALEPKYFVTAREQLPKSLETIKNIVELGFNAKFVFVKKPHAIITNEVY